MSKVLIIGDLHIGARNNSTIFMEYIKNYFNNELFPLIKKHNIKTVIQLGDTLDKRKTIDFTTSAFLIKEWLSWFDDNDVLLYSILGNHDTYYKNTNSLSGIKQYETLFKNVKIITEPIIITIDKTNFKLIPWVLPENKDECLSTIQNKNNEYADIICGHFELAGFQMMKGIVSNSGTLDEQDFNDVYKVYSGHYHTPSENKNIEYLGTPYNLTWSDYGDKKCVAIIDAENPTSEHVKVYTQENLFKKIYFNENVTADDLVLPRNGFVKVIVDKQSDLLEVFINDITDKFNLTQCQIIDNIKDAATLNKDLENIELDDPFSIMLQSIKNINNKFVEDELISIFKEAKTKNDNI